MRHSFMTRHGRLVIGLVGLAVMSVIGGGYSLPTSESRMWGTSWQLEDLGGTGVLDRVQATLAFTDAGRVAGNASCNRFFGAVELSGASISFGALGSTRMSCSEAVMRQERRYLRALEGAERFTLDGSVLFIYSQGLDKPLRFTRLNRSASTATGSFRASGTEPFWSLSIDRAGLRFTTPDNPEGVRFPIRLLTVIGNTMQWDGETENAAITARIRPGACSDGMSERVWTYKAVVRLNGATYQGCAEATSEAARFPDVMGEWMIVDHRIPGISALTAAEAARWHGRRIRLGTKIATSATNTCRRPVYRYRAVPADTFLQTEFRIAPADLGLQATARLALTEIFCTGARWAAPGGLLIRVSEGRLYTVWDGVFFELRRLAHNRGDE